jgi:hypothetical protein
MKRPNIVTNEDYQSVFISIQPILPAFSDNMQKNIKSFQEMYFLSSITVSKERKKGEDGDGDGDN